jgi:NADH:ubiquinone oxidoreductase subunit 3 (subunit A)
MEQVNPYKSPEESGTSNEDAGGARKKRGLGYYDLAAVFFVIAMLILLLAPAASKHNEPLWTIVLSGGCCLFLAMLVAGIGFARQHRRRVLDSDPVDSTVDRSMSRR